MLWSHEVSYFLGGAIAANALPHLASGVTGRACQSPFPRPPGQALSSSSVNVLWGFCDLVIAYLLLCCVGGFLLRGTPDAAAAGEGILLMSLALARILGRFHGGSAARGL